MSDLFGISDGATPLSEDDREGLIPPWIAVRADLDAAEQRNIALALVWARGRSWDPTRATVSDLRALHRRMFAEVWVWAGQLRTRSTNIGVEPVYILTQVEELVRDLHVQVKEASWSRDEILARFHHRLVAIHPFPNGNGRHARLAADLMLTALGDERFSWGARTYEMPKARQEYLRCLRLADDGDPVPLIGFARA